MSPEERQKRHDRNNDAHVILMAQEMLAGEGWSDEDREFARSILARVEGAELEGGFECRG